jgi:hypothetical protein
VVGWGLPTRGLDEPDKSGERPFGRSIGLWMTA